MVNIILATHGKFAEGIHMSGSMIFGEQENVAVVTFMPNEGPDDLARKYDEAMASFNNDAQTLFMVDLFGGSPYNAAMKFHQEHPETTAILTGLNLPMLIEVYGARLMGGDSAVELADSVTAAGRDGIRIVPEVEEKQAEVASQQETTRAVASEAVHTGEGQLIPVLARIDTRLLHGQVATAWTKATQPNRIIIVSDNVAKDELRKTMLIQAAPVGVKVNVIPIKKLAEVWDDARFKGVKALFLFEKPQDLLQAFEAGVDPKWLENINVGSMAHSEGKRLVTNAIAVDDADEEVIHKLADMGVKFDVRKVPSDSSKDLVKLLAETKK